MGFSRFIKFICARSAGSVIGRARRKGMFTSRLPHAFFALIIALSLSLVEPVDISLAIDGVGRVTVPGSAEPVDVILQFAREGNKAGHVLMKNHEYLTRMLDFFCLRRACARLSPSLSSYKWRTVSS